MAIKREVKRDPQREAVRRKRHRAIYRIADIVAALAEELGQDTLDSDAACDAAATNHLLLAMPHILDAGRVYQRELILKKGYLS